MKLNSRICVRCSGSKYIKDPPEECPNCSGEGIEYIISPEELKRLRYQLTSKEQIVEAIKTLENLNNRVRTSDILNVDRTIKGQEGQDKLERMSIYNRAIEELHKED